VTIRLYFDEDSIQRSLVRALCARGVDVITALDAGMIERKDKVLSDFNLLAGQTARTDAMGGVQ